MKFIVCLCLLLIFAVACIASITTTEGFGGPWKQLCKGLYKKPCGPCDREYLKSNGPTPVPEDVGCGYADSLPIERCRWGSKGCPWGVHHQAKCKGICGCGMSTNGVSVPGGATPGDYCYDGNLWQCEEDEEAREDCNWWGGGTKKWYLRQRGDDTGTPDRARRTS